MTAILGILALSALGIAGCCVIVAGLMRCPKCRGWHVCDKDEEICRRTP